MEVVPHDPEQTLVVLFLGPEETAQVLAPLEVGADDAAAVGEEVGHDEGALLVEDRVALGGDGAVGSLDDELGLHLVGVLAVDGAFERAGEKDVHGEEEQVLTGELLHALLLVAFEELLGVGADEVEALLDVQACGAVVGAGDVADGHDLRAGLHHGEGRVGANVAEALDGHGGTLDGFAGDFEGLHGAGGDAETRRGGSALGSPEGDGLAGEDGGLELVAHLADGVHEPDHLGTAGVHIRRGHVGPGADHGLDPRGEGSREPLPLFLGVVQGVEGHAALAAAVGDPREGTLPGHHHGEGLALVEAPVRMESDAALRGTESRGMLHSVAVEHLHGAVVHLDGDGNTRSALGMAQDLHKSLVQPHFLRGGVEVPKSRIEQHVR